MENGTAQPGISVAERLRRKRKITRTTTPIVSSSVNSTSCMEPRMDCDASKAMERWIAGGISLRNSGSRRLTLSTTSTVFVPGWRCTARITARLLSYHATILSLSTLSMTLPSSPRRTAVRLGELGNVIDSVDNDKIVAWYDNKRAVILAVQRQPGTNTVEVVDNVKRLLPEFRKEIPPAIHLSIAFDASQSIRGSIHDVEFTLLLTIGVVVLVIFLFLRNLSATLIPGCAVPFSIVGTFAVMYLLGYSLNNLSLMALTLSVGFVVDDAIVMLENIVRHMEMGETRLE